MARSTAQLTSVGALALLALLALLAPASASADDARFAVDRFEPAAGGSDWVANDSLELRGALRPTASVIASRAHRSVVVPGADGQPVAPLATSFVVHAGSSVVLVDRLRLAFDLPLQIDADGTSATTREGVAFAAPRRAEGIGDLRLGADVRFFGHYRGLVTGAVGFQMWLPTGAQSQWLSDGTSRARPRVMVAGEWRDTVVWAAQLGLGYRERSESLGSSAIVGSDLRGSAAVGVRLRESWVVGPEIVAVTVLDAAFAPRATPVEALLGGHFLAFEQLRLGAAFGIGVTSAPGAPERRLAFSIEWTSKVVLDSDDDGVRDDVDRCPHEPGIVTGDPKTNGCPAYFGSSDRDGDGIADRDDACPYARGPASPDPQRNGCPPDRDRDGIPDDLDACPDRLGVATRDPKTNGCPPDKDGDGVDDLVDACPTLPGPKTDDPATNGCPDRDRDKDGIPNDLDACPDESGAADLDSDRNGCPAAFLRQGKIHLSSQPRWKGGSAELEDESPILPAIAGVLEAHPEVRRVRVEGHTDNRGNSDASAKLSAARADAIVNWLVAHGIDRERLVANGIGSNRPLDTNETASGRANNQRIELHVVKP